MSIRIVKGLYPHAGVFCATGCSCDLVRTQTLLSHFQSLFHLENLSLTS